MFEEGILFQKDIEKQLKLKEKERRKQAALFHKRRYEAAFKSIKESEATGISIGNLTLDLLEELGFDRSEMGTLYLADVIETLYHERKVFEEDNDFFDFNNKRNNHYIFTNDYYECGLGVLHQRMEDSKQKSYMSDESFNSIVYGVTNDIISQVDPMVKKMEYKEN